MNPYSTSTHPKAINNRFSYANRNVAFLMLVVSLLAGLSSCTPPDDSVAPTATDEHISYKIDGKEYSDNSLSSLGVSAGSFGLWSMIAISNSFNSPGYGLKLYVGTPKIGAFTAQSGQLTGELMYIKSLSDYQTYTLSKNGTGTLIFTKYDSAGFAEGTFSFVAKTDKGQTITVTDGKFRIDLR